MKALRATVTLLLDPRVIGPDAQTEWKTEASACDFVSELLSSTVSDTVLDWAYDDPEAFWVGGTGLKTAWEAVEIGDPTSYQEGAAV